MGQNRRWWEKAKVIQWEGIPSVDFTMVIGQFEEMDGFLEGIDTAGSSALSYLVVLGFSIYVRFTGANICANIHLVALMCMAWCQRITQVSVLHTPSLAYRVSIFHSPVRRVQYGHWSEQDFESGYILCLLCLYRLLMHFDFERGCMSILLNNKWNQYELVLTTPKPTHLTSFP